MSSDYYRRQITQKQSQLQKHSKDRASALERAARARKQAADARATASRTKTLSTIQMKFKEAERHESEAAKQDIQAADADGKAAKLQKEIGQLEGNLSREVERENRKRADDEKKRQKEHERRMCSITSTLTQHHRLHAETEQRLAALACLPQKIVVLFLASNPMDIAQLRLDEEARSVAETIRKSKHRDAVKLESCWAVRALDVLQSINEFKPTVVHFSGHGSGLDEIVFQDNAGNAKPVSLEAIVQTMSSASSDIQLVFFNTCHSHAQAEAVAAIVGAAIGMASSITDDAARVFAAQFYSAIGFGLSLRQAFQQARAALMLEDIREEDTPQLYIADGLDADAIYLVRPPSVSIDENAE